jgi:hypothetical protein
MPPFSVDSPPREDFMHRLAFRWLLPAACTLAALTAYAQGAPRSSDPLDAKAQVPAFIHRSSLSAYRPLSDGLEPVPWPEANDKVGRIGGWRAYAREASRPEPAAIEAPATNRSAVPDAVHEPMTTPNGGHKMR